MAAHPRTPPCAGASPLLANVTSSGSVLLHTPHKCKYAPFEVHVRHEASPSWSALAQWGTRLPLEVGVPRCHKGCFLRLHSLDAAQFAVRLGSINANATAYERALNVSVMSDETQLIETPFPEFPAPHPPAARLEMMLRPPLPSPYPESAADWTWKLVRTLHTERFQLRSQRMKAVEVSSTGSFLMLDVFPEDIYAYVSGPDVPEVLLELTIRASSLNVSGHHMDVRYGLWRQAVEGTKIHGAVDRKKLWPRQHESNDASATAIAAAQAASAHATAMRDGDDDDDDSEDTPEEDEAYDTLDADELADELGLELDVDDKRSEPVLKTIVLLLTVLMLLAGGRQLAQEYRSRRAAFGRNRYGRHCMPGVASAAGLSSIDGSSAFPQPSERKELDDTFQKMEFSSDPPSLRKKDSWWAATWDPFSRLGYSMNL